MPDSATLSFRDDRHGRPWWLPQEFLDDNHIARMGANAFAVYAAIVGGCEATEISKSTGLSHKDVASLLSALSSQGYLQETSTGCYSILDLKQVANDIPKHTKRQPTNTHIVRCHFESAWSQKYNSTYYWSAKDAACAKRILSASGSVDAAKAVVDAFMDDADKFVTDACHPFSLIISRINRYIAKTTANGPASDAREIGASWKGKDEWSDEELSVLFGEGR